MSEHSFDSTPDMGGEFTESSRDAYEVPLEVDAQDWEPIEEPSEKHLEMHYTPGGTLEQETHTQIDQAARKRIIEAQNERQGERNLPDEHELDFAGDFDQARQNAWGWDTESQREYDSMLDRLNSEYDNDPFETGRRFERDSEPERSDADWER